MNRYLIERHLPGAGQLSSEELRHISEQSNLVLADLAPKLQWVRSFVSEHAITCEYLAEDEQILHEHARLGGFPIDSVRPVATVIDPMTAAR